MHLLKFISKYIPGGLFVAAVTLAGCKVESDRVIYRAGNSYFPLLDGRTLRYEEQRAGAVTQYTWTMKFAGGHKTKVYPLRIKGVDFGECSLLSHDSTVIFATSDPYTSAEPRETLPEYRQIWVDPTVKPGQNWDDDDTGTKTTFIGLETVEVPGGRFEGCYHTLTEVRPDLFDTLTVWQQRKWLKPEDYSREVERTHQVISRWFAPGVGLVKEQIGSDIIRVLLKIEKEGAGVVDTTKPETIGIQ